MSRVITLTTDFSSDDPYAGVMKGAILNTNPDATIVDITHSITPQNVMQGAFVLNLAYRYFPKDSIHLAVVDPGVGGERVKVILRTSTALFVAPDNGLLSYIIDELSLGESYLPESDELTSVRLKKGLEAVAITDPRFWREPVSSTFHGRDIFAPVAAGLSLGISPYEFGEKIGSLQVLPVPRPFIDSTGDLVGQVIYVDHFGNLITDIRSIDIQGEVAIEVGGTRIYGVSRYYEEAEGFMAVGGSSGYLEVSLKNGNAADSLGVITGDPVRVTAVGPS
jgi:hypothetical protein